MNIFNLGKLEFKLDKYLFSDNLHNKIKKNIEKATSLPLEMPNNFHRTAGKNWQCGWVEFSLHLNKNQTGKFRKTWPECCLAPKIDWRQSSAGQCKL